MGMPDSISTGWEKIGIILRWVWTRRVVGKFPCRPSGSASGWTHYLVGLFLHGSDLEFDHGTRLGLLQGLAGVVWLRKMRVRALLIHVVAFCLERKKKGRRAELVQVGSQSELDSLENRRPVVQSRIQIEGCSAEVYDPALGE